MQPNSFWLVVVAVGLCIAGSALVFANDHTEPSHEMRMSPRMRETLRRLEGERQARERQQERRKAERLREQICWTDADTGAERCRPKCKLTDDGVMICRERQLWE